MKEKKEEEVLKAIRDLRDKGLFVSHRSVARETGYSYRVTGLVFKSLQAEGLLRRVGGEWQTLRKIEFSSLTEKLNAYIEKAQRENKKNDPARKARISERRGRVEEEKDTFIPFGPKGPVYRGSPPPNAPFEDFVFSEGKRWA